MHLKSNEKHYLYLSLHGGQLKRPEMVEHFCPCLDTTRLNGRGRIWGVIPTVLWNGASGEAVCNWQVGALSSVLMKLSFFLKEKVCLQAVRQARKRQQAERESVQLPILVASGCCRLGKQRTPSHPGGTPAPAPHSRPRVRVWLTTL